MKIIGGRLILVAELLIISALVLTTRCANYPDIFVGPNIYFVDPDCYARMTRVRLCAQTPGLILRHHTFENFPEGTTPHTTAPFDYAILFFSVLLAPFSVRNIDLAGAWISPLCGVLAGTFLCWWSRIMAVRFRWALLILFVVSPILVHATALGRPDHQSAIVLLTVIAICAEATLQNSVSRGWSIVHGLAWGLAIWISTYEPLVLLVLTSITAVTLRWLGRKRVASSENRSPETLARAVREHFAAPDRRLGWMGFGVMLVCALIIERRVPSFSAFVRHSFFENWASTIGELRPVSLLDPIWLTWVGWLGLVAPILILIAAWRWRGSERQVLFTILLGFTFCLTMWQARWGYFFAALFCLALPGLLAAIPYRAVGWALFACSLWPVMRFWDSTLWPEETAAVRQLEQRREAVGLRDLSLNLISAERQPFLAPWWLSPAITYWSGQPGVAGSSHESLPGIVDSAMFYLSEDGGGAGEILRRRKVVWVIASDADRVMANSAAILGKTAPERCLARILDQRPSQAPPFLVLVTQTGTEKLFRVERNW